MIIILIAVLLFVCMIVAKIFHDKEMDREKNVYSVISEIKKQAYYPDNYDRIISEQEYLGNKKK